MTNVNGNFFQDYLLNNEKWLSTDGEAKGQHQTDGKLDESEISVFFSSSHIEMNGDSGDGIISSAEFEEWYAANETAISAFMEAEGFDYDDQASKNMMRESMVSFAQSLSDDYVAEEHNMAVNDLNMNGVWKTSLDPTANNPYMTMEPADNDPINDTPEEQPVPRQPDHSVTTDYTQTVYGETTISTEDAISIARQLYNGGDFDKDKAMNELLSGNYTSADIVMIMRAYEEGSNKSLMSDIQGTMSGKKETQLRELLYGAALDEASLKMNWREPNDVPSAIMDLAKEYNQAFRSGNAKEYLREEFANLSEETKAQVILAAQKMNSGTNLMEQLTSKTYAPGVENKYVNDIINSLLHLSENKPNRE